MECLNNLTTEPSVHMLLSPPVRSDHPTSMEFLDEYESRPRFIQSKQLPHSADPDQSLHSFPSFSSLHKPTLFGSLSLSILILFLTFFYFNDVEPIKSLLLWLSLSLFLGPFAPPSLTAGDIRVGLGPAVVETPKKETFNERHEKFGRKFVNKQPPPSEVSVRLDGFEDKSVSGLEENEVVKRRSNGEEKKFDGAGEWSDADWELLRKLVVKHPVGKPGRWEAIADGFKGKHSVESVIVKAKELGQRKVSDQDSYKKFLKDRKGVDQRVSDEMGNETSANQVVEEGRKVESRWSAAEDLALLNALKTFPKDVAMRWEKIAASLPGKTKSACMKRVSELKKDFRSSKAS